MTSHAPEYHDDAPHPADAERSNLPAPLAAPSVALSASNEAAVNVLAAQARAEIEARTFMALKAPRNINSFRLKVLDACKRPRFAESARYAKPLGGKNFAHGFSIRFAEECARQYRNLHIGTMVVSEDDERRVVRVACMDLEANVAWSTDVVITKTVERRNPRPGDEVLSRRQNSTGQAVYRIRADDDALLVKQNAQIAKAARNLILDHVPSDILEEAEEAILETVKHQDAKDPGAARKRMVDAFYQMGVSPEQLEAHLGHALDLTTLAEMQALRVVLTAMKDGDGTWAELTGAQVKGAAEAAAPKSATEKLRQTGTKPKPSNVCEVCGGTDGQHLPTCKFFAD